jgi:hypothetical protein
MSNRSEDKNTIPLDELSTLSKGEEFDSKLGSFEIGYVRRIDVKCPKDLGYRCYLMYWNNKVLNLFRKLCFSQKGSSINDVTA